MAIKLVETPGWNAGARTIDSFADNGAFQFKVGQDVGIVCGLNDRDNNAGYTEIDHAFYVENGTYRIIESGVFKTAPAPCPSNPRFRITRTNGIVRYYVEEDIIEPGPGSLWLSGLWITEFVDTTDQGGFPSLDGGYTRVRPDESHPSYNPDDFLFTYGDYLTIVTNNDDLGLGDPPYTGSYAGWGKATVLWVDWDNRVGAYTFQDITIEQQAEGDNWLFIHDVGYELSRNPSRGDYMRLVSIQGGYLPSPCGPSWSLIDVRSSKSGAPSPTASPVDVTVERYDP